MPVAPRLVRCAVDRHKRSGINTLSVSSKAITADFGGALTTPGDAARTNVRRAAGGLRFQG